MSSMTTDPTTAPVTLTRYGLIAADLEVHGDLDAEPAPARAEGGA